MFVIYNLPCRECGTTKPHGDLLLNDAGEQGYMEFIDSIKASVDKFPNTPVAFIIEPEAITNLVVYKDAENCKAADPVYRRLIAYAIQSLAGMNVHLYLDGGHSGLLGWDDKIAAAAGIAADIYQAAGSPVNLHGVRIPPPPSFPVGRTQQTAVLMRAFSSLSMSGETISGLS